MHVNIGNRSTVVQVSYNLYYYTLCTFRQNPIRKRYAKFPCTICDRNVNTDGIECSKSFQLVHHKCDGTSKEEFKKLCEEPDYLPFYCLLCTIEFNAEIFPLNYLDKSELNELNGIDLPSLLSLPVPYETHSKLTKLPNLGDYDLDESLVHIINSKYYETQAMSDFSRGKVCFSLLHSNLRSLSAHVDELRLLLNSMKLAFDIGISEKKEQVHKSFLSNVNLSGYDFYSQPLNSSAGGVALNVNSKLNYIIREDLNFTENEFQCIWIEIKNSKSQNMLCCCAYRDTQILSLYCLIDYILIKSYVKLPKKITSFL